jgi:hypothetical protein
MPVQLVVREETRRSGLHDGRVSFLGSWKCPDQFCVLCSRFDSMQALSYHRTEFQGIIAGSCSSSVRNDIHVATPSSSAPQPQRALCVARVKNVFDQKRMFLARRLHPKRQQSKVLSAFKPASAQARDGRAWRWIRRRIAGSSLGDGLCSRARPCQSSTSMTQAAEASGPLSGGMPVATHRALRVCWGAVFHWLLWGLLLLCCVGAKYCCNISNGFSDCNTLLEKNSADASPSNQHYIISSTTPTAPSKPPDGLQRQCCVLHSSIKLSTGGKSAQLDYSSNE